VQALLSEALKAVNEELFKSWHLAKSQPDVFKAMQRGSETVIRRAEALLTAEDERGTN